MKQLAVVVVMAVVLGACKCSKTPSGPVPVERVLPKGALAVVVVPRLGDLGQRLTRLESLKAAGFVAQLQGFASGKGLVDVLMGQLGLDVRDAAAMAKAGVDGARPLGAAVLITTDVVLALPVADEAKLGATLERLAKARLGAGVASTKTMSGLSLRSFSTAEGQPARLGYVFAHGYALVTTDEGVARLTTQAAMPEGDSLVGDATLAQALKAVGGRVDAFAFAPAGSPALMKVPVSAAFAGATLEPTEVSVAVWALAKPEAVPVLEVLRSAPGPDTTRQLPFDAFLVGRLQAKPAALAPYLPRLWGPLVSASLADAGLEVGTEVLGNVSPGASFALSLAPKPPMDRGVPTFDIRQTNPFTYAHLSGVAHALRPDEVSATLEKLAAAAPKFGARIAKEQRAGGAVFVTSWAQGEGVHFAAVDGGVVLGSPLTRVEALLGGAAQRGAPVPLPEGAVSVALDLSVLANAVKVLPDSAWGLGGFAMKATTVRWLEATDDLQALSGAVWADGSTVRGRVQLKLAAPGPVVTP